MKYIFYDKLDDETLKYISAEDEEEAWVLLTQRHSNMGKGAISVENAKERYKLNSVK